jgi:cell division protein FtsB
VTTTPPNRRRTHDRRTQDRRVPRASGRRAPAAFQRAAVAIASVVRRVRNLVVEARSGHRPLVVVLVVAVGLAIVMLSGPTERYLDGRTRVDALRNTAEALDVEIDQLEGEVAELRDPDRLELLAREQQGMVRPGEVPYTLAPPEVDRPRITAARGSADDPTPPWYARAWDTVRSWF